MHRSLPILLLASACNAKSTDDGVDTAEPTPEVPCDYAYVDADGDGYGAWDPDVAWACPPPEGTVGNPRDCDDSDPSVYPQGSYTEPLTLVGAGAELPQALVEGCYDSLDAAFVLRETNIDLSPLRSLGSAQFITIAEHLRVLEGLEGLEDLGTMVLESNALLEDLEGVRGLRRVGTLQVSLSPELESLTGLRALEQADLLHLVSNNAAGTGTLLVGLDAAERIETLTLMDPGLQDFTQLPEGLTLGTLAARETPIRSLEGVRWSEAEPLSLSLIHLPELVDLQGLTGVEALGYLHMSYAPRVETLAGLEGVRRVEESIELCSDERLADVSALHGVESVGGGVLIADMPSLAQADAEALIEAIGEENIGVGVGVNVSGGCD